MRRKLVIIILLALLAFFSYSFFLGGKLTQALGIQAMQDDRGMTLEAFNKKINNPGKLVLVYFHADWCVPCVKLIPEIAALEAESKDMCEVVQIDTDYNKILAEHFEINTLPMFILYKDGKKIWENSGYQSKQQLQAKIDAFRK